MLTTRCHRILPDDVDVAVVVFVVVIAATATDHVSISAVALNVGEGWNGWQRSFCGTFGESG